MFAEHFNLASFLAVITLLTLSPGADTLICIRNTLRGGWMDGWLTTLAICSGLFVHATVSALGVAALLAASPAGFQWLQWAGAGYLGWLGWRSVQASFKPYQLGSIDADSQQLRVGRSLREGFLSNVLNPKTMVVYLALLPQFIDPALAWRQSIVLAGIHFALSVAWLGLIVLLVERARVLMVSQRVRVLIDRLVGGSLIVLAGILI